MEPIEVFDEKQILLQFFVPSLQHPITLQLFKCHVSVEVARVSHISLPCFIPENVIARK